MIRLDDYRRPRKPVTYGDWLAALRRIQLAAIREGQTRDEDQGDG